MLLHSDTWFWFRANLYLFLLPNVVCLIEKQQIPILQCLVWPYQNSNPWSATLKDHQCSSIDNKYSQTCFKGYLYITNHCLKREVSFFPLMKSAYNFNLYIKGNCSWWVHFQVPLSGFFIYRFDCNQIEEVLILNWHLLVWQVCQHSKNKKIIKT